MSWRQAGWQGERHFQQRRVVQEPGAFGSQEQFTLLEQRVGVTRSRRGMCQVRVGGRGMRPWGPLIRSLRWEHQQRVLSEGKISDLRSGKITLEDPWRKHGGWVRARYYGKWGDQLRCKFSGLGMKGWSQPWWDSGICNGIENKYLYVGKKLASLRGKRRGGNKEMEGSRMTPSFWLEAGREAAIGRGGALGRKMSSEHIGLRSPWTSSWRCSVGS